MNATLTPPIEYPDCDGNPMADNTLQYRWISTLMWGLSGLFRNDPNVFVAGDLLWYPVEGVNTIRMAPDAMVVFGRPKGDRGSYRQWEEGDIPPQVVFEVRSPGNRAGELAGKLEFYDRYGVEEYYLYDPDRVVFSAYARDENGELKKLKFKKQHVSPRLGVKFDMSEPELVIYLPNGERMLTYLEMMELRLQEMERANREAKRARVIEAKNAKLIQKLRDAGIDPDAD